MKKIIFLTALFTTLFIGLTACSDNEPEIENLYQPNGPTETLGPEPIYEQILGILSYDKKNQSYHFTAECGVEDKDTFVINRIGHESYQIIPPYIGFDLSKYIGEVCVEIDIFRMYGGLGQKKSNLLKINSFVDLPSNYASRSFDFTPEFNTPPPAWFFKPQD